MVIPISLEKSFEHMVLRKTEFFILYWLNGEELQDCICDNYDEATKWFDYLKVNWQFIFPYGFTALELVDQYFDPINQFNPITDSPD